MLINPIKGAMMKVIDTKINGVKIIEPKVFEDVRGFFLETFNAQRYKKMLDIEHDFIQDNHSRSVKNVLRGLHLQTNNPQGKLVRVVHGEVLDVAVDIRKNSPTFGLWESVILSESNKNNFGSRQDLLMVLLFSLMSLILNISVQIITILQVKNVFYGMMLI